MSSRNLNTRLVSLEAAASKREANEGSGAHEAAKFLENLESNFEQGPKESWVDVVVREFDFSSTQALRTWLKKSK